VTVETRRPGFEPLRLNNGKYDSEAVGSRLIVPEPDPDGTAGGLASNLCAAFVQRAPVPKPGFKST
jgi:hypothetical protein